MQGRPCAEPPQPHSRQGPRAGAVLPPGSLGAPVTQSGQRAKELEPDGRGRAPANKIRLIHYGFYEDLLIFFNL